MATISFSSYGPAIAPNDMDRPIRVAIIDDDESVRRALCRLLRSHGIDALAFDGGVAFLEKPPESLPDCLLIDVCMPDMDGPELLQRIRGKGWDIPAILITAHDDDHTPHDPRFPGAIACHLKPLDNEQLLRDIRRATALRKGSLSNSPEH